MKLSELNFGKVIRDGEFNWLGLTAEEYKEKKHLTFLTSDKYIEELNGNETVSCVITLEKFIDKINKNLGIIVVDNPKKFFFELHNNLSKTEFYNNSKIKNVISKTAIISETSIIKENNIIIEDDVVIEDFVVIYPNVTIKKGTRIGTGTIIGSRPFQILQLDEKTITINSIGNVVIEENSEILCNVVIVKGVFGNTYLGKRVCIDNFVHIAHDVKIGDDTLIVAGTVIGGRTQIGKKSYTGINSSLKNGIIVGNNSKVNMGAVVSKDVEANQIVTGNLAIEHSKFIENLKNQIK